MKTKWGCLAVRCLVAACFVSGTPAMLNEPKTMPQDFPLSGFMFCLVVGAIQLPLSYKRQINREKKTGELKDWSRPSWFSNPFSGPSHFMHMGGNAFIITGLVGLIQSTSPSKVSLINLFPLVFGWSIVAGNILFYEFMFDSLDVNDLEMERKPRNED